MIDVYSSSCLFQFISCLLLSNACLFQVGNIAEDEEGWEEMSDASEE